MLLSNQQKYIIEVLRQLNCLRTRQLHALVQAHYQSLGVQISEERMEVMLRQLRTATGFVRLNGELVSYGEHKADVHFLEAVDVMLELTDGNPAFYSIERSPFLLRFAGNGTGAGYLFRVAWLDAVGRIAATTRQKGERLIWLSDSTAWDDLSLPRHHFFAVRQTGGTHRFFGSNEPEKI